MNPVKVVKPEKKIMFEAWSRNTETSVTVRPIRSETTPATMRPAALKTARRATKTKPVWMALFDWAATILARWPMIMRPAVAPKAYWNQSSQKSAVRIMSRQVASGLAALAAAEPGAATLSGLSGLTMNCASTSVTTKKATPSARNEKATPWVASSHLESGAM